MKRLGVLLLIGLSLMGGAKAWILEVDVILTDDEGTLTTTDDTTLLMKAEKDILTELTFETTGAPIIQGYTIDFHSSSGPWQWNLTNLSMPLNLTVEGNVTQSGTLRLANFPGFYKVEGVYGFSTFIVQGPTFTLNILPANQTISVTPTQIATNGLQVQLDSDWNPTNNTIASSATVTDTAGNPLMGAVVNHTIFGPDGSLISYVTMTETSVLGLYVANVTLTDEAPDGPYTVAAIYGGTLGSQTVIKQSSSGGPVEVSISILNTYLPLLVWGGIFLMCLWFRAWLPMTAAILAVGSELFTPPLLPIAANVMLLIITLVVHTIITNRMTPHQWRK